MGFTVNSVPRWVQDGSKGCERWKRVQVHRVGTFVKGREKAAKGKSGGGEPLSAPEMTRAARRMVVSASTKSPPIGAALSSDGVCTLSVQPLTLAPPRPHTAYSCAHSIQLYCRRSREKRPILPPRGAPGGLVAGGERGGGAFVVVRAGAGRDGPQQLLALAQLEHLSAAMRVS